MAMLSKGTAPELAVTGTSARLAVLRRRGAGGAPLPPGGSHLPLSPPARASRLSKGARCAEPALPSDPERITWALRVGLQAAKGASEGACMW